MKRIIYPNEHGTIGIIVPSPQWPITDYETGLKDVPKGVPFKIVDITDIPEDRTFRQFWTAEFDEPDGYGLGPKAWYRRIKDWQSLKNILAWEIETYGAVQDD